MDTNVSGMPLQVDGQPRQDGDMLWLKDSHDWRVKKTAAEAVVVYWVSGLELGHYLFEVGTEFSTD